jgi:hypothetical protein
MELINRLNNEKMYWIQVSKRVIVVLKFISSKGLTFN